jgi:hypothetical protein
MYSLEMAEAESVDVVCIGVLADANLLIAVGGQDQFSVCCDSLCLEVYILSDTMGQLTRQSYHIQKHGNMARNDLP